MKVGAGSMAAFLLGVLAAAATPNCYQCDCPKTGPLFETTMVAHDVVSYSEDGRDLLVPPFGMFAPTVHTSPTEVRIDYESGGAAFTVVYAVLP